MAPPLPVALDPRASRPKQRPERRTPLLRCRWRRSLPWRTHCSASQPHTSPVLACLCFADAPRDFCAQVSAPEPPELTTPASSAVQTRHRLGARRPEPPRPAHEAQVDYACRVLHPRPKPARFDPRTAKFGKSGEPPPRELLLRRAAPPPRTPRRIVAIRSRSNGPKQFQPKSTQAGNGQRRRFCKRDPSFHRNQPAVLSCSKIFPTRPSF